MWVYTTVVLDKIIAHLTNERYPHTLNNYIAFENFVFQLCALVASVLLATEMFRIMHYSIFK